MSKIGKKSIIVPEGVEAKIERGKVFVWGPKGKLELKIPRKIKVEEKENQLLVTRITEEKKTRASHGAIRQLVANAIRGVTEGWEKKLEVVGTGYRAAIEDNQLVLLVGFSHQLKIKPPEGIKIDVEDQKQIKVSGADKALVGQVAAQIRRARPPDSYKGKGIRYEGEEVKLKPGKAAKGGVAGEVGK